MLLTAVENSLKHNKRGDKRIPHYCLLFFRISNKAFSFVPLFEPPLHCSYEIL